MIQSFLVWLLGPQLAVALAIGDYEVLTRCGITEDE